MKKYSKLSKETNITLLNTIYVLLMLIIYILVTHFIYGRLRGFDYQLRGYLVLSLIELIIIYGFSYIFGSFKIGTRKISDLALSRILGMFFCAIISYSVLSLIDAKLVNVLPYLLMFVVQSVICVCLSYKSNSIIRKNYLPAKALVIYGNSKNYKDVINKIKLYQEYEFEIIKCIKESSKAINKLNKLLSDYDCVVTIDVKHEIKKIIIKTCYENDLNVYDVPSITDVFIKSSEVTNFIDTPLFKMNKLGPSYTEKLIKRVMDIFGSLLLLLLFTPIMLIIAIAIKLYDGGDVFFKQKRLTKNGKVFELIKFRSMIMNAEPNGKMIRAKINDERITKIGKVLRSTRLDELPQVFNILKGDMSFVGPRALRIEEYEENEKSFPEFKYRLKVQAGLTGYAQIYGKYNTTFKDKLLLDIYYIENYSIILDISLILITFVTMLFKDSTEGF